MPKVALIGHYHECPEKTNRRSHVGGPVISGQALCTVNGKAVAVIGDQCSCEVGGPDTIVSGASNMTINGKPVAIVGSSTAHGGQIVEGEEGLTVD